MSEYILPDIITTVFTHGRRGDCNTALIARNALVEKYTHVMILSRTLRESKENIRPKGRHHEATMRGRRGDCHAPLAMTG